MSSDITLKYVALALSLAIDALFLGMVVNSARQLNVMRKRMVEADRDFLNKFPQLRNEKHLFTNQLTLSLLWVVIIALLILASFYLVTCSRLYALFI